MLGPPSTTTSSAPWAIPGSVCRRRRDRARGHAGARTEARRGGQPTPGRGRSLVVRDAGDRGTPQGTALEVVVPARRPLPPGTIVSLFAERDGRWESARGRGPCGGHWPAHRARPPGRPCRSGHTAGLSAAAEDQRWRRGTRRGAAPPDAGGDVNPRRSPAVWHPRPERGRSPPGPTPVRTVFSECLPGEVIGNCSGGLGRRSRRWRWRHRWRRRRLQWL